MLEASFESPVLLSNPFALPILYHSLATIATVNSVKEDKPAIASRLALQQGDTK
jgi:hypothetical protein